jgi:hypothetical protein
MASLETNHLSTKRDLADAGYKDSRLMAKQIFVNFGQVGQS